MRIKVIEKKNEYFGLTDYPAITPFGNLTDALRSPTYCLVEGIISNMENPIHRLSNGEKEKCSALGYGNLHVIRGDTYYTELLQSPEEVLGP